MADEPTIESLSKRVQELDTLRGQQGNELAAARAERDKALAQIQELQKAPRTPEDFGLDSLLSGFDADAFKDFGRPPDDKVAEVASKHGLPKKMVAEMLDRDSKQRKAMNDLAMEAAVRHVGGQQQYENLKTWWKSLPDTERAETDKLLSSPTTLLKGLDAVVARHRQSVGAGGSNPLLNGTSGATGSAPFKTMEEANKAANDLGAQGIDPYMDEGWLRRFQGLPNAAKYHKRPY